MRKRRWHIAPRRAPRRLRRPFDDDECFQLIIGPGFAEADRNPDPSTEK